ncbi:PDDEXK nuclease domain-containing protein [Tannockella kyphosi]|uniref:PDDEXK nuclease domain-containing protein n=1 Tax=Tannockella kyphosi TaxID=2899121 RepID=UPI00201124B0|nr:PDDEXK nuclease domain-containing protein [Tannockella kyphosi]
MELEKEIVNDIRNIVYQARDKVYQVTNNTMVQAYYEIGRTIVEKQGGKEKAEYGSDLIKTISKELSAEFGTGFKVSSLKDMRQFYLTFSKSHALRGELSWTHYRLLMRVENEKARNFYEEECVNSNWSTRQLERQIHSFYYERLLSSKDGKTMKDNLSDEDELLKSPSDIIKDPYVLEFLGLPDQASFSEKELESALISHLQKFLLELGRGFSFIARQKRITFDGRHFYIDLLFYNYLLKCFVIIDLKIGDLTHQDLGQMQMYVNYYEEKVSSKEDNPPIGIVLCVDKSESLVKYTLPKNSNVYASRYKLYLPSEEELRRELHKEYNLLELEKTIGTK